MKSEMFAIVNKKSEITRVLSWESSGSAVVIKDKNSRRVEVISKSEFSNEKKNRFELISEITKGEIRKNPLRLSESSELKCIDKLESKMAWAKDAQPTEEEQDRLPFYLKRTSQGYIGALAAIILVSFAIDYFIKDKNEPIVVTVFKQDREIEKRRTVRPSRKPIPKKVTRTTKTKPRKVVASNRNRSTKSKNVKVKTNRPALNPHDTGPLAVFGGMDKKHKGAGGLNLNSKSSTSGLGKNGNGARGGHSRGLVGAGLVVSGSGSDDKMVGYNGSASSGIGGGSPGYGSQKIGGSSAGYSNPMSEDSFIEGGLDQDQINAVVQRNIGQVLYCYEQGLQSKPSLSGRVAVHFIIGGSGRVNSAKVSNTSLRSSQVESCILSKLKNWKFPKPVGRVDVRVTYPFSLKRLSQG